MTAADTEEEMLEVTAYGTKGCQCFWFVGDGERPCGQTGHYRIGSRLRFCHIHYKKFLSALIVAVGESPMFRDVLMNAVADYDDDEVKVWTEHRRKIRPWNAGTWRAHSVYFAERHGFVKIGRTSNIAKRMHDIGKGSCMPQGMSVGPVRLLALIHCDCTEKGCVRENYFHDKFKSKWLEGEWFLLDSEMASFIGGLAECLEGSLREVSAPRKSEAAA